MYSLKYVCLALGLVVTYTGEKKHYCFAITIGKKVNSPPVLGAAKRTIVRLLEKLTGCSLISCHQGSECSSFSVTEGSRRKRHQEPRDFFGGMGVGTGHLFSFWLGGGFSLTSELSGEDV
jgi:hypothetical protein